MYQTVKSAFFPSILMPLLCNQFLVRLCLLPLPHKFPLAVAQVEFITQNAWDFITN